ncbi:MAG TPA: chemotaxis protein, partial [Alteromonas macleodii]|nr:chemotaxis protein [Alteromonas macleodii]
MFVSRSKYEEKEAQVRKLEARVQEALDKIDVLEAENSELINAIEAANGQHASSNDSVVMKCIVDAMRQLEGIRETVLATYQRIDAENQSVANIHELFSDSATTLSKIVTDM